MGVSRFTPATTGTALPIDFIPCKTMTALTSQLSISGPFNCDVAVQTIKASKKLTFAPAKAVKDKLNG